MVTTEKSVRQSMKSLPQTSGHRQVEGAGWGEAAKGYSFPFGCGANVLELTAVGGVCTGFERVKLNYTPYMGALCGVPIMS